MKKRQEQVKINLSNLYHISGGDDQFVKQMLISFIDSTQKGLIDMRDASISGDMDSVSDLAHKMLPPCRHVGASDLCTLLRKIEENSQKNPEPQSIINLVEESLTEFSTISELVSKDIAKIN